MGASIRVEWTDGPSVPEVEEITNLYSGAGFDGMIDMKYYKTHFLTEDGHVMLSNDPGTEGSRGSVPREVNPIIPAGATEVHFGADYIFPERQYSEERMKEIVIGICKKWGIDAPEIKNGWITSNPSLSDVNHWQLSDEIHKVRQKLSYYDVEPEPKTTEDYTIKESWHTKESVKIWIVKGPYVSRDRFFELKKMAKIWNGYYSKWSKGYLFYSVEDAEEFRNEAGNGANIQERREQRALGLGC
jgi:hypothetical protein